MELTVLTSIFNFMCEIDHWTIQLLGIDLRIQIEHVLNC